MVDSVEDGAIDVARKLITELIEHDPEVLSPSFQFTEQMHGWVSLEVPPGRDGSSARMASDYAVAAAWGRAQGLVGPDSLLIGVPQDDPSVTPLEKQRFDVCIQVPEFRRPAGGIGAQTLGPGLYGVGRHYGSFENLAATYAHVYDTCVLNGAHQLRVAPPFEVYGHTRVNDDLRIHYTDVFLPIEPADRQPRPR